jgi:hypothetical protein
MVSMEHLCNCGWCVLEKNMNAEFRFGVTLQTNITSEVRQVESRIENAEYQEVKIASGGGGLDKPTQ